MTARTTRIQIPQGDFGYDIAFTCRDSQGSIINIAGYTIHFKVWTYEVPITLLLDGIGGITDAPNGKAYYTLAVGDFSLGGLVPAVGDYLCEMEATKVGERTSYQSATLEVTESG